jgi:hypothetical protein
MLHGLHLHGYTPYAHRLGSGSTKWIIWQIAYKRKSTNILSYSKQWIRLSYHLLHIIHDYKAGTSWVWSHIMTRQWHRQHDSAMTLCHGQVSSVATSHHAQHCLDSAVTSRDSAVPSPAGLGTTVASMTRHLHYAAAKSPQQCHRQHNSISTSCRVQVTSVVPSSARLGSTITSMTRHLHRNTAKSPR